MMIKTLAAALAALSIAAPASAAVRTIDFSITQQNGWQQYDGTEFPFGLSADQTLTGQVLIDDQLPGVPRSPNGVETPTVTVVGLNYTTGGKTWTLDDLSDVGFVALKDDKLEHLWLFLLPVNEAVVIWTPTGTAAVIGDGVNRAGCSGCVSFVERIGDEVISTGGPGLPATGAGVPEPATWAMMITGFGLAGTALRRRRTALAA